MLNMVADVPSKIEAFPFWRRNIGVWLMHARWTLERWIPAVNQVLTDLPAQRAIPILRRLHTGLPFAAITPPKLYRIYHRRIESLKKKNTKINNEYTTAFEGWGGAWADHGLAVLGDVDTLWSS